MRSGNASSFKMMGSSPAKVDEKTKKSKVAVDGQIEDAESDYKRDLKNTSNNLTKKPVGPVAGKIKVKKGQGLEGSDIPLSPGFEDPIKIQKVQREGLTPNSQKFSKKAKENEKNAK